MATSYDIIEDLFLKRIEKDEDFIDYVNLTDTECLELAKSRIDSYREDALSQIALNATSSVDFLDYDDELRQINFDMTRVELRLLIEVMFVIYMSRDIPKLHVFMLNFTPSEMEVFSPANERNSFLKLISMLEERASRDIDRYSGTDRLTGARKGVDYEAYLED